MKGLALIGVIGGLAVLEHSIVLAQQGDSSNKSEGIVRTQNKQDTTSSRDRDRDVEPLAHDSVERGDSTLDGRRNAAGTTLPFGDRLPPAPNPDVSTPPPPPSPRGK